MSACVACRERGQTWRGDAPRCAFSEGVFGENWNCATVNMVRDVCYEGQVLDPLVHYQYCDDQKYSCINLYEVEGLSGDPYAAWLTWYKNRGRTDQIWLLYNHQPPQRPTEKDILKIVEYFSAREVDS